MKKKEWILLGLCSLTSIILQGNLLRAILPSGVLVPNLLLIIVVYMSYRHTSSTGAVSAFCVGLLFDLYSGGRIGPWAGSFVFLYGWLSYLTQRFLAESSFSIFVVVFIASVTGSVVALTLASGHMASVPVLVRRVLIEATFTAVVAPVVFPILQRFLRFSQNSNAY